MDQDDLIFIPLTTAQRKVFGTDFPGSVSQIIAKADSLESANIAQADIQEILRNRHNLGKTQENDFEIRNSFCRFIPTGNEYFFRVCTKDGTWLFVRADKNADIEKKTVFLLDPMLATGGSAIDAIELYILHSINISFLFLFKEFI